MRKKNKTKKKEESVKRKRKEKDEKTRKKKEKIKKRNLKKSDDCIHIKLKWYIVAIHLSIHDYNYVHFIHTTGIAKRIVLTLHFIYI